jgi:phage gp36-like protein
MMTYASPTQIRQIMRKLPSSVSDEEITSHIEKASALIDGLLGEAYVTPFNPVPKLIESLAIDLTIYFLAETLYSSNMPNLDEYQEKRYKRAMEMLNMIAKGDLYIGVPMKSTHKSGFASTNDADPIFTLDEPEW